MTAMTPSSRSTLRRLAEGWGCAAAFSLLATLASAADPVLEASLDPEVIRPGSVTTFTITVSGGNPDSVSGLQLPDGVEVVSPSPGFGQQITSINGVTTRSLTLTWQITSETPGEHDIPAQELHIGGVPFKTNATKLVVKDSPSATASQSDPIMTLEVAKREFYLGEVVPITANLYIHRRTLLRRVGLIELPKDSFAIQRFPLQGEESAITMGGVPYRALAYHSTLSALKPGKFKLGPATAEIMIEVMVPDDRFQHPFFSQTEPRKVRPTCNDIEVNVLPLPTEGRPANFSGAVGDFEISLTAQPDEVAVNDPVSVEMVITGSGNFDALTTPVLTEPDAWKTYPPRRYQVQGGATETGGVQSIGFNQILIPKSRVAAVPPFEFSYFSPTKKRYVTLRTKAQPLKVKGSERSVEPLPVAASEKSTGSSADDKVPTVKPKITDILAVVPPEPVFLAARPAPWQDRSFVLANAAAAGALLLMVLGKLGSVWWTAHVNSPDAPARRMWRQLQGHGLSRAAFYSLAAGYISTKGLHGETVDRILERHQQVNYGRDTAAAAEHVTSEERAQVLAALKGSAS